MNHPDAYYSAGHALYHNRYTTMGTRIDVVIQGRDRLSSENAFNDFCHELKRLDGLMSRYDEHSEVSMINRLAFRRPVEAGRELFGILQQCRDYHKRTLGIFDIGLGEHTGRAGNVSADRREPVNRSPSAGMQGIILDPEQNLVRFSNSDIQIDLGGFGKGYAMESARTMLISSGISNAFISFGNSSILALGNHPSGSGWMAGIQHLMEPAKSVYKFVLHDESVSTSGAAGIIHPRKGQIESGKRHVSVKSPSATDAEVLSTTLILAEPAEALEILSGFPGCQAIIVDYEDAGNAVVTEL